MKKIFEEVLKKDGAVKSQKTEPYQQAKRELKSFPGKTFEVENDKEIDSRFRGNDKRYIPVALKRSILSKTDGKCVYPNCQKPVEILHHTDFSHFK